MKWYEPLIWNEFIDYFSDGSTTYFQIDNGKRVCDEMLLNYYDVVNGLTLAHICKDLKRRFDPISARNVSEYTYKAYCHFLNEADNANICFNDIWDVRFCSFFRDSKIKMKELTAEQLALCIMYPFWERWGSNFIDNANPKNGRLKDAVLTLAEKHTNESLVK